MDLSQSAESWRALVIEDEYDNLDLLLTCLASYGATASGASSGQEGIDLLEMVKPNLILLDLTMPGLDGWQVHRLLRERSELDNVPIIAVTALVMPMEQIRIREAGFDGYITKPYRIRELSGKIAKCIDQFIASKTASAQQQVIDDFVE